ncbi:putative Uncharacterized lipoprotein yfhM [Desulfamplus magnetovallimortis]|uniref:Putative Uncharacterized lipoprotein yfhM n=1 Tax=Desulfamplus magnetovallimortis TaxID=1246637 RepID=A0A1W1HIK2_9BACT|nr:alpha-2-macroglobulin [Desulfamplus magnetovallimortis]SLM32331.1 putative Uncharacterized lipoprotein yfhM [Desulfamplus magnetovallimortis]
MKKAVVITLFFLTTFLVAVNGYSKASMTAAGINYSSGNVENSNIENSTSKIAESAVEPLEVQFAAQQTVGDTNAIALTFSLPLDTTQNFDSYFSLFKDDGIAVEGGWVLSDDPNVIYFSNIEPGTAYTIKVHKGLKGLSGAFLKNSAEFNVKTRPVEPMIAFGSTGFILASKLVKGLPVNSVNIDKADIDFFRVKEKSINDFFNDFARNSNIAYYMSDELNKITDLVYSGRWDLDIKKDLRTEVNIPVTHIEQLKKPGVYVAVLKGAGIYEYNYSFTWFTISDLGVHARRYENELQVHIQSLETAKPLSDILVEAYDKKGLRIVQVKTNTIGLASMRGDLQQLYYIIARNKSHISLLKMDVPAMDLSEFKAATEPFKAMDLFVYGPRDLYRPGETVVMDALLRKHDGEIMAALPVSARVFRPDGRMASEFTIKSSHPGYYHHEYSLPSDALTGSWRIDFNHAGNALKPYFFTVAEFLPERMKLIIDNPEFLSDDSDNSDEQKSGYTIDEQSNEKSVKKVEDRKIQGDILGKNDPLFIALQGDYLYGAPASGSMVDASLSLVPAREIFPEKWPGYEAGDITENLRQTFKSDKTILDDNGKGLLKIPNQWSSIKSPAWLTANASLYESGGRAVVRSRSWRVWPADSLLAIRSLADDGKDDDDATDSGEAQSIANGRKKNSKKDHVYQVKSDSVAGFEVISLDRAGQRVAASGIKALLIREHRDYYWEYKNGSWKWQFTRQFYPVERFSVDIPHDGSAMVNVSVKWGGYRLELTHPETGLVTSFPIWAGWRYGKGGWSEAGEDVAGRPDRISISLDKPSYYPGDIAKVMVKAPEGGSGYLFVEAETNLLTRSITVPPEGKVFEIEIEPDWKRHDIYVSALVVRPGEVNIKALPKRSVGLIHLPIDRNARKISLDIEIPDKIEPDQFVDIPVSVFMNKKPKEKIWVTLAAVDVGILNLTEFETPSPWSHFFQPRKYGVELHDLYQKLIETGDGAWASQRFGGDAPKLSRGGDRPSTDVQIVALYSKAIPVDGNGVANFRFHIPDFNGSLRFMAVAHGSDIFGSAEKEVVVAAPLVVQISMPRFLSMGDRSQVMIDLHNLSGVFQDLDLLIETTEPLKPLGATSHHLKIANNQRESVTLPVMAEQKVGRAIIQCKIDGIVRHAKADLKDVDKIVNALNSGNLGAENLNSANQEHVANRRVMVKKWFLETRPAYPAVTETWRKSLKPSEIFSIGSGDIDSFPVGNGSPDAFVGLIKDTITVSAAINSTPPINVSDHVRYLNAYPYGCLEQTTSGIYPHVIMNSSDIKSLGIASQSDRERTEKIILGIQRLVEKQKSTGGFGLWNADSQEDFWLSAYVTDFLINARQAGYEVPLGPLSKALDRLLVYVRRGQTVRPHFDDDNGHYNAAVRAYSAMVLARVQSLTLGDARSVYRAVKDKIRGSLGLVQAGIALYLAGDANLAMEAFQRALDSERNERLYYGDYGSNLRDAAFSFYLLSNYAPDYGEKSRFIMKVFDELHQRKWLSTQERNTLVMAGISAMKNNRKEWQAKIKAGARMLSLKGNKLKQIVSSKGESANGFTLANIGSSDLFIDVAMNGYPKEKPKVENLGATLKRRYLDPSGKPLPASTFYINALPEDALRSGRRMIVELQFDCDQDMSDAIVTDLLPACLELEDPSLNGRSTIGDVVVDEKSIATWHDEFVIKHREYRDDRFAAAVDVDAGKKYRLFYSVVVVTPGEFFVPPPLIEDMYRPYIRGVGDALPLMPVAGVK